jgi:hypothetical protein
MIEAEPAAKLRLKSAGTLDGFDVLPGFRLRVAEVFTPPDFPPG